MNCCHRNRSLSPLLAAPTAHFAIVIVIMTVVVVVPVQVQVQVQVQVLHFVGGAGCRYRRADAGASVHEGAMPIGATVQVQGKCYASYRCRCCDGRHHHCHRHHARRRC